MSATGTRKVATQAAGTGKVVVNRAMSLDGFIAGPGHAMDWVFGYLAPDEFPEIMTATGAMLAGRRTYEVGQRDAGAGKASGEAYGGAWSGPQFVLTHQPPDNPQDPAVTFLSGDIEAAVATARKAAGSKNVEILGADVARPVLKGNLRPSPQLHRILDTTRRSRASHRRHGRAVRAGERARHSLRMAVCGGLSGHSVLRKSAGRARAAEWPGTAAMTMASARAAATRLARESSGMPRRPSIPQA